MGFFRQEYWSVFAIHSLLWGIFLTQGSNPGLLQCRQILCPLVIAKEVSLERKWQPTPASVLAWRIPWTEEPGRLQSMGSQRVGHDLVTKPPPPRKSVSPTCQQKVKELLSMIDGRRRRGQQRMRWLDIITSSMDMSLNKLQEVVKTGKPVVLQSMAFQRVRQDLANEQQKYHRNVNHFLVRYRPF